MELEITHSRQNSPVRIASTRFGDIVVSREFIWEFPEGLIGFRSYKSFALVNTSDESESYFIWLHSTTRGDLALPVMNPLRLFPEYTIRQDEPGIMRLGLKDVKEIQVLVIVTVPAGDPEGITANLAAPLILWPERNKGWQVILEKGPYRVAQPLFPGRDEYNEGENIVSVGTLSPPVAVIGDVTGERRSQSIIQARGREGEVMSPPENGA